MYSDGVKITLAIEDNDLVFNLLRRYFQLPLSFAFPFHAEPGIIHSELEIGEFDDSENEIWYVYESQGNIKDFGRKISELKVSSVKSQTVVTLFTLSWDDDEKENIQSFVQAFIEKGKETGWEVTDIDPPDYLGLSYLQDLNKPDSNELLSFTHKTIGIEIDDDVSRLKSSLPKYNACLVKWRQVAQLYGQKRLEIGIKGVILEIEKDKNGLPHSRDTLSLIFRAYDARLLDLPDEPVKSPLTK